MVLDANTYGTVARVEIHVGHLVASRTFSGSTVPTTTQVETLLDDVADELNHALRVGGYTVPVAVTGNDKEANGLLARANSAGAAMEVLNLFPTVAVDPDQPDPIGNQKSTLSAIYKRVLDAIIEGVFAATKDTGRISRTHVGSYQDADGKTKAPIFTRNQDGFPGTRTLKT